MNQIKKLFSTLVIFWVFTFASQGFAEGMPYPNHTVYTQGTIKPSNATQLEMDEEVKNKWEHWRDKYLLPVDNKPGQYYVRYNKLTATKKETVSEAHGYGMMLAAYMAGSDPNAKIYFDGMYHYFKDHPSSINSHLMAWRQVNFITPKGDDDSATDGDLDIAFALLLADKQWGSSGAINYLEEAKVMINAIMDDDINHVANTLKLGDWSDPENEHYMVTRPSDFMLDHLRVFRKVSNDPRWDAVIAKTYSIINMLNVNGTGLLPDFATYNAALDSYVPVPADFDLESAYDGEYYYNACRTPWRITTDYLINGNTDALSQLTQLNNWIKGSNGAAGNAGNIYAGYELTGQIIVPEGPNGPEEPYSSAAFVAPFGVSAMLNPNNQAWLNAIWNFSKWTPSDEYYEDSIQLLSMLVMSGNWWAPTYED